MNEYAPSLESSNSVSHHLELLSSCCDKLVQTLRLSREQVRSYASRVVQSFRGSSSEDLLLVDRVLRLLKQTLHHARDLYQSLIRHDGWLNHHDIIRIGQHIKDTLTSLMQQCRYIQQTFGWMIDQLFAVIDQTMQKAHV